MGGEDLEKLDVTVDDEAVYSDTRTTLEQARKTVSHAVNAAMVGAQGYYEYQSGHLAGMDLNACATMPIEGDTVRMQG